MESFGSEENSAHNKYCHFCQHIKVSGWFKGRMTKREWKSRKISGNQDREEEEGEEEEEDRSEGSSSSRKSPVSDPLALGQTRLLYAGVRESWMQPTLLRALPQHPHR